MTSTLSDVSTVSDAEADAPDTVPAQSAADDLHQAAEKVLGHSDFLDVLQVSRRGGLALIRHQGELKVFKFINCRADWKKRWARLIGWNPARRAVNMSRALTAAGVDVCEVEDHGGVSLPSAPRAVWTISRYVEHGRTLRQLKQHLQPGKRAPAVPEIDALFADAMRLLRRIHDAGFEHRDYHAGNLLVTGDPGTRHELRLVDLETVMRRRAGTAERARDVRRFLENFVEPQGYRQLVNAALEHYAPGDAGLQGRILNTRRMRGLLRKEGARWDD